MKEIIENAAREFARKTDIRWNTEAKLYSFEMGAKFMQQKYEEQLRWIPVSELLPVVSEDKKDWWTSDIKEVFPYSRACIVENTDGERFINQYSINENCWSTWCGEIVKWRYLEPKLNSFQKSSIKERIENRIEKLNIDSTKLIKKKEEFDKYNNSPNPSNDESRHLRINILQIRIVELKWVLNALITD